ncbi:binding--dependent transport system inner membrane component family protein [Burkholderia gladioli]|nr:binding--dependent transport system inner membrane component family protein [Burkholderia gladioli]KGC10988.1 binding--dependent transport system inner membrane component family protein [Burkholderia gladioli]
MNVLKMSGAPRQIPRPWRQGSAALRVTMERLANYGAFLVVAGLVWTAVVAIFHLPDYLLPSPAQALNALVVHAHVVASAAWLTVWCTVVGTLVAMVVAIGFALLFVLSPLASRTVTPLLIVIRTIPMIAVTPLIIVLFGRDRWNTIGMVALLTFFQVMLAAKKGFEAPGENMLELMRTCGASFTQTLIKVRLPCAIPYVFTGLRLAASSAILCAMFAEWLSGSPGLGTLMLDAYSQQQLDLMWAAILVSTTVAYLFFTLTIALERAVLDRSGT